ncbi:uncharacterized protein LOC143466524 isoform X1 [Clavelina lepadiformis]|uniref:uncharacterized protein LOC143466524 isoform X1 n=1 Tax=Clavelina lepadiformis TaxID=159417 RepID=UPI0040435B6B
MASPVKDVSFMDQCTVTCLSFLKTVSSRDSKIDADVLSQFQTITEREIEAFNFPLSGYESSAQNLVEISLQFDISLVGRIATSVESIEQSELTQQTFQDATKRLIGRSNIKSWEQVSLILHLMYFTCTTLGVSRLEEIVNLTVRCLHDVAKEFIIEEGGWESVPKTAFESEEILSSIVMVQKDEQQPTLDSPPFSMLQSLNDEEERESLSSATPPEILDRPQMTASLIQMMGGGDATSNINSNGNTGTSSDSNEFEMVGSIGSTSASKSTSPPPSHTSPEPENEPVSSLTSRLKSFAVSEDAIAKPTELPSDGGGVSDYLPHISIGVAAAAACIGIFMLKKAS